jgi:hypothetical protein
MNAPIHTKPAPRPDIAQLQQALVDAKEVERKAKLALLNLVPQALKLLLSIFWFGLFIFLAITLFPLVMAILKLVFISMAGANS